MLFVDGHIHVVDEEEVGGSSLPPGYLPLKRGAKFAVFDARSEATFVEGVDESGRYGRVRRAALRALTKQGTCYYSSTVNSHNLVL